MERTYIDPEAEGTDTKNWKNTFNTAINPNKPEIREAVLSAQESASANKKELNDDIVGSYEDALLMLTDLDAYDALGVLDKRQEIHREKLKRMFSEKFGTSFKSPIATIEDADHYFVKKLGVSMLEDLEHANRLPKKNSLEAMKARAKELELQLKDTSTHTPEQVIERIERNTEKVPPEKVFEMSLS